MVKTCCGKFLRRGKESLPPIQTHSLLPVKMLQMLVVFVWERCSTFEILKWPRSGTCKFKLYLSRTSSFLRGVKPKFMASPPFCCLSSSRCMLFSLRIKPPHVKNKHGVYPSDFCLWLRLSFRCFPPSFILFQQNYSSFEPFYRTNNAK